jgi:hypothetical protein
MRPVEANVITLIFFCGDFDSLTHSADPLQILMRFEERNGKNMHGTTKTSNNSLSCLACLITSRVQHVIFQSGSLYVYTPSYHCCWLPKVQK